MCTSVHVCACMHACMYACVYVHPYVFQFLQLTANTACTYYTEIPQKIANKNSITFVIILLNILLVVN